MSVRPCARLRVRSEIQPNLKTLARAVGFEPTTNRLTADCSTAELRPNTAKGAVSNRLAPPGQRKPCFDGLAAGFPIACAGRTTGSAGRSAATHKPGAVHAGSRL